MIDFVIETLENKYVTLSVTRGTTYNYVSMGIKHCQDYSVDVLMKGYLLEANK